MRKFSDRHIGISKEYISKMYEVIGVDSCEKLMYETIPDDIRIPRELELPETLSESEWLSYIKKIAQKNKVFKSYIGQGYYETLTPSVILRNIFENPGWYTQYTPYQAEISQGRLEALLNFQTMVSDLTGMPLANASLLDEGTAAAEAMAMMYAIHNKKRKNNPAQVLFADKYIFRNTREVLETRAKPLGIEIVYGDWKEFEADENTFGVILQYPNSEGCICDYSSVVEKCKAKNILSTFVADIMSLALLSPPGEWGADIVCGNTQRFGVPLAYGGPHAAYFATKEEYKRQIPGRIIGVSKDSQGKNAYRMALQTREQHIKREKATSNICTAQALLAIMAGMYASYHGKEGLIDIANQIHSHTVLLHQILKEGGFKVKNEHFFDTIRIDFSKNELEKIKHEAENREINFFYDEFGVQISIGENASQKDIYQIARIIFQACGVDDEYIEDIREIDENIIPQSYKRSSDFLSHPVFNNYKSETSLMRYIKKLENKDMSLVHSMIPLGSCTMKLNAASEMIPVSWPEFANIHPFAPLDQTEGYQQLFRELSDSLCEITGFTACTLQPNSGAQGEYTGLMAIRGYHASREETHRDLILIPSSAHGTNPASAIMAGMDLRIISCDDEGNIDLDNLRELLVEYGDRLAGLMVTYPSTHGVYESKIKEICNLIHEYGGLVYLDGANLNAQIGYTNPGVIGADVCHLNLHKTFAIPHGGGGPGVGPVLCNDKLARFLPGHYHTDENAYTKAVSSAPWGSAGILMISYGYIRMMGSEGLKRASEVAILNANYIYKRLETDYKILYTGTMGRVAHEFILDLNPFKALDITAEDVAKRMMDYGFHAPTVAFPVAGTLMIEPTESEDLAELDRFCEALLEIKKEIDEVASGEADPHNNVLKNAPHPAALVTSDDYDLPYSREKAAYPVESLRNDVKFWPSVGRIDNAFGDRNLFCSCIPVEEYIDA